MRPGWYRPSVTDVCAWLWIRSVRLGCWEVGVVDESVLVLVLVKVHFVVILSEEIFAKTEMVARNGWTRGGVGLAYLLCAWLYVLVGQCTVRLTCWEVGIVDFMLVFALPEDVHFVAFWLRRCLHKRKWLRAMVAHGDWSSVSVVCVALCVGRLDWDWVAERLESLMLFLLVFVLAKVHFVAF